MGLQQGIAQLRNKVKQTIVLMVNESDSLRMTMLLSLEGNQGTAKAETKCVSLYYGGKVRRLRSR
jgi:hypothetical protein